MRLSKVVMAVAAGAAMAVTGAAAPAYASPSDMPCTLTLRLFCSVVPALPNLDHDIDLTQDPNALDGTAGAPGLPGVETPAPPAN